MFVLLHWVRRFQQFDLAVEHKFRGLDIKQAQATVEEVIVVQVQGRW